ncbi:MAG: HD domain-containing protein [Bacillota bacterium]
MMSATTARRRPIVEPEILARSGTFALQLMAVRRWAGEHLGDVKHEQRVMQVAVHLFDLTAHLHGLGSQHRRLLKLGALLHDVGRYQEAKKHHVTGAKLILNSRTLPLNGTERQVAAYLARYHRGEVPAAVSATYLPEGMSVTELQLLLAILRAADTLDNRRLQQPTLILRLKGRRLRIKCWVDGQWRRARRVFQRRRKFKMLRQMLNVRVKVQVKRADLATAEAYQVG